MNEVILGDHDYKEEKECNIESKPIKEEEKKLI